MEASLLSTTVFGWKDTFERRAQHAAMESKRQIAFSATYSHRLARGSITLKYHQTRTSVFQKDLRSPISTWCR